MIRFARRMWELLRRRAPAGDDGARFTRKGERGEPQPEPDPIAALVKIVGEADASEHRRRAKPTTARRTRSRPR